MKRINQKLLVFITAVLIMVLVACTNAPESPKPELVQPVLANQIQSPALTVIVDTPEFVVPEVAVEPCVAPQAAFSLAPSDDAYPSSPNRVAYPEPSTLEAYPSVDNSESVPVYTYQIIDSFPHDANAFTQGLVWEDGQFFEGTGLNGRSSLRRVQPEDGVVQQMVSLGDEYFGEGITIWDDRVFQITWKNGIVFVYDKNSFAQIGAFTYDGEGWGITHDGRCLIMSDGTDNISFRDPMTFEEIGRIRVFDQNGPVFQLNELEYIDGEIFANIWFSDRIVRIDPQTGQVLGWIDLTNLLDTSNLTQPVDVLNGIAVDAENGRIFVTGKLWPTIYEIELSEN